MTSAEEIREVLAAAALGGSGSPLISVLDRLGWHGIAKGLIVQGARGSLTARMQARMNTGAFKLVFDMSREAKNILKEEKKRDKTAAKVVDGHLRVTKSLGGRGPSYVVTVCNYIDSSPSFILRCRIHSTRIWMIGKIVSLTKSFRIGQCWLLKQC